MLRLLTRNKGSLAISSAIALTAFYAIGRSWNWRRNNTEPSSERRDLTIKRSWLGGFEKNMSTQEARNILGLGSRATRMETLAAHRRVMKANHPDSGGSTYLSIKVNEAKVRTRTNSADTVMLTIFHAIIQVCFIGGGASICLHNHLNAPYFQNSRVESISRAWQKSSVRSPVQVYHILEGVRPQWWNCRKRKAKILSRLKETKDIYSVYE